MAEALIVGAIFGTVGAIQQGHAAEAQGRAEQEILDFNAAQKMKEAEERRKAASEESRKFAEEGKRRRGTLRVGVPRAGVLTEGTPALLLEETAQELEADRLAILEQGFLEGEYAESQAYAQRFAGASARARGKNIKRGSYLAASGTLLTGIGEAYNA